MRGDGLRKVGYKRMSEHEHITWDWNKSYEAVEEIKKALRRLGLHIYSDPIIDSGSTFSGILISKDKLGRKDVRRICKNG